MEKKHLYTWIFVVTIILMSSIALRQDERIVQPGELAVAIDVCKWDCACQYKEPYLVETLQHGLFACPEGKMLCRCVEIVNKNE